MQPVGVLMQTSESMPGSTGSKAEKRGLFGDLTLQRAHATGHAVWLYLPSQGVKLRCNELIHKRSSALYSPTRPISAVTPHGRSISRRSTPSRRRDLTKARSLRSRTSGPSTRPSPTRSRPEHSRRSRERPWSLEIQPDRDQPVERIAIWQDKLFVQNEVGPRGERVRKIIHLTGNRPCFIDKLQKTSLDSASLITVWLKPQPQAAPAPQDEASPKRPLAPVGTSNRKSSVPVVLAGSGQTPPWVPVTHDETSAGESQTKQASPGGGSLQMERLLALQDVHMLAPAKIITAHQRLDAEFVEVPMAPATPATSMAATRPVKVDNTTNVTAPNLNAVPEKARVLGQSSEQATASDQPEKEPLAEPLMVGSAEQIWARLDMEPNPNRGSGSGAKPKTASTRRGSTESKATIRKMWMFGNVALHKDPAKGKSKGQRGLGEAFYLDNRGENKAITYLYQHDPREKASPLPSPLPPAWVEDEEKIIKAAGIIKMNQETDQVWVEGPGTLVQLAEKAPTIASAPTAGLDAGAVATATQAPRSNSRHSMPGTQAASLVTQNHATAGRPASQGKAFAPAIKRAASRPVDEKAPSTIRFSERMEFVGQTTDPEGNPSGRADFYGIVTTEMEDALLHCEEKMIAFTDRAVPLAELGEMSKAPSKPRSGNEDIEATNAATNANDDDEAEEKPKPQLALIKCYGNAVAITRKVDPDAHVLLKQERIEADEVLNYDRRTGAFDAPGKGTVYLYDRSNNSTNGTGKNLDSGPNNDPDPKPTLRTVTNTSGGAAKRSNTAVGTAAIQTRSTILPPAQTEATEAKTSEFPPLVLTQIRFEKGMRGVYLAGAGVAAYKARWSEFFGDVQLARAKVKNADIGESRFNFDKLPRNAMFLTGETMRGISEPPPVGSPSSAPARDSFKAWEKAYFQSSDKSLQADWITYDSEKDLVYAYAEGQRGIIYAQQHAAGQPSSLGSAKAWEYNPKTGATHFVDNASIQMIDKNTGVRPGAATPTDPDAKPKKPAKRPFKLPSNNLERRGFTGQ